MLVVGAGGLAAQIFEELEDLYTEDLVFWSEYPSRYAFIADKFTVISTDEEVRNHFQRFGPQFLMGVGGVATRKQLKERFLALGGEAATFVSPNALVSKYVEVGQGAMIMGRVEVEAGAVIGADCLLNKTANIGHGCVIGQGCEISPGVILTGDVQVGAYSFVATRAIVLPKVQIGTQAVIAAGSIVKKNVPDLAVVAGEFATVKFYQK
jgi:sugar O-acyltransferase (sialic acid O-acetyltransferase NeuD family)